MRFKVGDKVRVKRYNIRPEMWNYEGEMDWCMGEDFKISKINPFRGEIELDRAGYWVFDESDLDLVDKKQRYHTNDFYLERCGV